MAERRVKTPKGVSRYDQPIGTTIDKDGNPVKGDRPVTAERLMSIQRQIAAAVRTGNKGVEKSLRDQFALDLRRFSKGKSPSEVVAALRSTQPGPR